MRRGRHPNYELGKWDSWSAEGATGLPSESTRWMVIMMNVTALFLRSLMPPATNWEGWRVGWAMGSTGGQTIDGVLVTPVSSYGWSDVFSHKSWARSEGSPGEPGHPASFGAADQTLELPFYAVSQVLTVIPGGTPVPAGTLIMFR